MTQQPEEDFGNDPVAYKPPGQRALEWAEDIRTRPLTDEQAISLAQVFASLAAVEQQERLVQALETITTRLEAMQQPLEDARGSLERFLALWSLSGGPEAPTAVSETTEAPSTEETA